MTVDARVVGFKQLVADIKEKFADDTELLKDLRRFRSGGNFPDAPGDTVRVGQVDVKDRSLFIKKVAERWYLENKQNEEKAMPEPEKK